MLGIITSLVLALGTLVGAASQGQDNQLGTTTDGQFQYTQPQDGWTPVLGSSTISEKAQKGENGQVSTIWGNGSQGQTERNLDHPRNLQLDSKGNIYFIDGSQKTAKVRMFNGKKNSTVVDLVNNRVSDKDGYFFCSGLAIIHDNVYVSNTQDVYLVEKGRITQLDLKISDWMKQHAYNDIYRMKASGNYIYMMMSTKSYYYAFVRYNVQTRDIEEVLPERTYPAPYNFFIYGDNDIFIATQNGYVVWEQLEPRVTKTGIDTGDRNDNIYDVWIGQDGDMYYSVMENQVYNHIYRNPKGNGLDDLELVAGGRRGFVDGVKDEVELDQATDFVWDGTGYLFGDIGNNSIRKLWIDVPPSTN